MALQALVIDLSTLVKVVCPKCANPLTQDNLIPGHTSRHRCKRCGEWTVVIVVGVAVPPECAPALDVTATGV